jgi:hypothetical protein
MKVKAIFLPKQQAITAKLSLITIQTHHILQKLVIIN